MLIDELDRADDALGEMVRQRDRLGQNDTLVVGVANARHYRALVRRAWRWGGEPSVARPRTLLSDEQARALFARAGFVVEGRAAVLGAGGGGWPDRLARALGRPDVDARGRGGAVAELATRRFVYRLRPR